MASLINKPLTSLCNSNSGLCLETRLPSRCRVGFASPSLKRSGKFSYTIVCRAVSVKPQTEIEGLNIAEDVTQVSRLTPFLYDSPESLTACLLRAWNFLHRRLVRFSKFRLLLCICEFGVWMACFSTFFCCLEECLFGALLSRNHWKSARVFLLLLLGNMIVNWTGSVDMMVRWG